MTLNWHLYFRSTLLHSGFHSHRVTIDIYIIIRGEGAQGSSLYWTLHIIRVTGRILVCIIVCILSTDLLLRISIPFEQQHRYNERLSAKIGSDTSELKGDIRKLIELSCCSSLMAEQPSKWTEILIIPSILDIAAFCKYLVSSFLGSLFAWRRFG